MRLPRFRFRTLMIAVAVAAILVWFRIEALKLREESNHLIYASMEIAFKARLRRLLFVVASASVVLALAAARVQAESATLQALAEEHDRQQAAIWPRLAKSKDDFVLQVETIAYHAELSAKYQRAATPG